MSSFLNGFNEASVVSVALFERRPRVTVFQSLSLRFCKRNVGASEATEIWPTVVRLADVPTRACSQWHACLHRSHASNINSVSIGFRNQYYVAPTQVRWLHAENAPLGAKL